jgi:hypothetical protein
LTTFKDGVYDDKKSIVQNANRCWCDATVAVVMATNAGSAADAVTLTDGEIMQANIVIIVCGSNDGLPKGTRSGS